MKFVNIDRVNRFLCPRRITIRAVEQFEGTSIEAIGRRLQLTRQVFGLQQNEFCSRASIATNTYNQFERGKKRPTIENAIALCEAYDLTLDWIYRGDPSGLRYDTADAIKSLKQARSTPPGPPTIKVTRRAKKSGG